MATRHTYASTDDLRDYLAGTTYASGWTSDAGVLRRIVEAASARIDHHVGMQSFGPRTETRYFDMGLGSLRDTPQLLYPMKNYSTIGVGEVLKAAVPLDAWLISATTVTSYDATDRSTSETLTEGYANDYFLEPYNTNPKVRIKLNEDTSKAFNAGQQTLSILGEWGYGNDTLIVTTADAVGSTTATSVSVSSASDLGPAETILVDSEQLYITSISGNTLTVERGVNGTTAATHSGGVNVSTYEYPPLVVSACLDLGRVFFRDRDSANTPLQYPYSANTPPSDFDSVAILSSLDRYRSISVTSEVYF